MTKISTIIEVLENFAPLRLQEDYDNSGLIIGNKDSECKGILLSLDVTLEILQEAILKKCNLIVAHHPLIFRGLKKINGHTESEQVIIQAIKHDISIYACHTNIDNVLNGVNHQIAEKLGLVNRQVLSSKTETVKKLVVFVPKDHLNQVETALFNAGAGSLGNYSECSFVSEGLGAFHPQENAKPFSGKKGERTVESEQKLEVIFPFWVQHSMIKALRSAHPYEEIAYEIYNLENSHQQIGSGLIGELTEEIDEVSFLDQLHLIFNQNVVKHSQLLQKKIKRVSICGGSGAFLTQASIQRGADIFITADLKYHDYFEADGKLILADIGHFESEQFTIDLFYDILRQKFPTFALLKTEVNTNPVRYFIKK